MAKTVVNPTAELPPRPGDVLLSLEQLAVLSVFASAKKAPSFAKFPGSYVLRHFEAREAICHQGQPGQSAYYMLSADDLAALSGSSAEGVADLAAVQRLHSQIAPAAEPRRLATARLLAAGSQSKSSKGFWSSVLDKLGGQDASAAPSAPHINPISGLARFRVQKASRRQRTFCPSISIFVIEASVSGEPRPLVRRIRNRCKFA